MTIEKSEALQQKARALKQRLKKRSIYFIIFAIIAVVTQRIGYKTTSKEDLKENKYQCENYIRTEAVLANEYKQLQLKRLAREVDINTFYYIYEVNGTEYKAQKTSLSKEPDTLSIAVWYDKANPSVNKTDDPCEFYNKIKDRPVSSFSNLVFYICMASLLVVIYLFFSILKTIGKLLFNKVEKKIVK